MINQFLIEEIKQQLKELYPEGKMTITVDEDHVTKIEVTKTYRVKLPVITEDKE